MMGTAINCSANVIICLHVFNHVLIQTQCLLHVWVFFTMQDKVQNNVSCRVKVEIVVVWFKKKNQIINKDKPPFKIGARLHQPSNRNHHLGQLLALKFKLFIAPPAGQVLVFLYI